LLVRGGWYAREVKRSAIDHWQHLGTSTRRTAEVLRSWLGKQERWQGWRPLDPAPTDATACQLSASTVGRWLDQAGATAAATVREQVVGVESSGQMATDGLWARLRGGARRVVLVLVDSVTGVVWPPVVVAGEGTAAAWATLFQRAEQAGLVLRELRGIASDGATGLESYRRQALPWVSHQRCVFHLWRGLSGVLTAAVTTAVAATELTGAAARRVARQTRRTLSDLVRGVYDAATEAEVQAALARLAAHEFGQALADLVAMQLEAARYYRCGYNQGLGRASPEWLWRDFRLRSSRGRNHGAEQRLERAALLWALYHNFEPAQERRERRRQYRHPGQAPLALAGLPPGDISYLDALAV
jgi:Transposase, Mutator family